MLTKRPFFLLFSIYSALVFCPFISAKEKPETPIIHPCSIGILYDYGIKKNLGSAFIAGKNKYVITCDHCIRDASRNIKTNISYDNIKLKIKHSFQKWDIAILEPVNEEDFKNKISLTLGDFNKIKKGDPIQISGYDVDMTNKMKCNFLAMSDCVVKVKGELDNGQVLREYIEYESIAKGGYSGCPVFNENGEVIAIHMSSIMDIETGKKIVNRAYSFDPIIRYIDSKSFF